MLLVIAAAGCGRERVPPPDAAFVVAAGDSTFLVARSADGYVTRRSPLLLAWLDSAFHEVYVVDEDVAYDNALFLWQRVYRRNLVTGDSTQVYADSVITPLAVGWRRRHPTAQLLGPDEELTEEPLMEASTDTELHDVVGPYLSYTVHLDIEAEGPDHRHESRRGVVDLRTGRAVGIHELTDTVDAARVLAEGRRRLSVVIDSITAATDERADRARAAVKGLVFDAMSFELALVDTTASVSFVVPGRGADAGGYTLPLGDIALRGAAWVRAWRGSAPTESSASRATWADSTFDVVATVDSSGTSAGLVVQRGGGALARDPHSAPGTPGLPAPRSGIAGTPVGPGAGLCRIRRRVRRSAQHLPSCARVPLTIHTIRACNRALREQVKPSSPI